MKKNRKPLQRAVRLTEDQMQGIQQIARERGMDFAGTLRYALDLYLDNFLAEMKSNRIPESNPQA